MEENILDTSNYTPQVSFIIVTYNNEKTLKLCLQSVSSQKYSNFEIIMVDGGSRDSTITIASNYATKIIELDKNIVGNSRQVGVENSSGDVLFFLDSDSYLPSLNYLSKAISKFNRDENVGVVELSNKAPDRGSIVTRCYFNLWKIIMYNRIKRGKKTTLAGGNALFLRKAVNEVGGFNRKLHFGDDNELGNRIVKKGYNVVLYDKPLIHDTMKSFSEFTRKQLWGATTLSKTGFSPLGLSIKEAFHEQIILGFKGMVRGLFVEKEFSWIVFPLLLSIRMIIYTIFFMFPRIVYVLNK